jgi:hypothetical protein
MWGGQGAGGGGAPRRREDGGVIANLRSQPSITRHSESPVQAERRRRKQEQLRTNLEAQIREREDRKLRQKMRQKMEQERWDAKYGSGVGRGAAGGSGGARGGGGGGGGDDQPVELLSPIELREREMRQQLEQQQQQLQQHQEQLQQYRQQQNPQQHLQKQQQQQQQPQQQGQHAASVSKRNVQHALANPDKDIQFMTSEAKAAVDKIKREKYLAELAVQIEDQKQRRREQKEQERREDLRRERDAAGYTPFGRHGAGAPLRDTGGRVITNLRKYNSPQRQQRRREEALASSPPPPPPAPPCDEPLPGLKLSPTEWRRRPRLTGNRAKRGEQSVAAMVQNAPRQAQQMQHPSMIPCVQQGVGNNSPLVEALRSEIADLRSENAQLRQNERNLKDQLFSAKETIERLAARVAELNRQFSQ